MGIFSTIIMPLAVQGLKHANTMDEIGERGKQDRLTEQDRYNWQLGQISAKGTQDRLTGKQETENRITEFRKTFPLSFVKGLATGIAGGVASGAAKGYFTQKFRNRFDNDKHDKSNKGNGSGTTVESDESFWNRLDQQVRDGVKSGKIQPMSNVVGPRPGQVLPKTTVVQAPGVFNVPRTTQELSEQLLNSPRGSFSRGRGVAPVQSTPGIVTIF